MLAYGEVIDVAYEYWKLSEGMTLNYLKWFSRAI
jgi:hypothetical protein